MPQAIVTDIEGTTSSLAFVKDVLFPYAAKNIPSWLRENRLEPTVRRHIAAVAETIGRPASDLDAVIEQLLDWIEQDVKATPLKALQGMLWKSGYESGDYRAHVYEDACQVLQNWHGAGIPLYVYSSGSVQAQELFFRYSDYGDLRALFAGYFDTTTGPKTEEQSYRTIAADIGVPIEEVLFLSDAALEIDAALLAGMQAILIVRETDAQREPGNERYTLAHDFYEVRARVKAA